MRFVPGLAALAGDYDALLLDLWGVLHDGRNPYPGVLDCLARLRERGKRLIVLSNAPRRAAPVAARAAEIGIAAELYDHLVSSGEDTWQALKTRSRPEHAALGRRCLHIGPSRDENLFDGLDLERVDLEEAEFILNTGPWGWEERMEDYEDRLRAARARELPMVCANPDLVVMFGGRLAICAGALAHRYEELGGRVLWHGKPYPGVYERCFELLDGIPKDRILAVGDSLRTDIAGANAVGIDSLFIAGGIHAEEFGCSPGALPSPERLETAVRREGHAPTAVAAGLVW